MQRSRRRTGIRRGHPGPPSISRVLDPLPNARQQIPDSLGGEGDFPSRQLKPSPEYGPACLGA